MRCDYAAKEDQLPLPHKPHTWKRKKNTPKQVIRRCDRYHRDLTPRGKNVPGSPGN